MHGWYEEDPGYGERKCYDFGDRILDCSCISKGENMGKYVALYYSTPAHMEAMKTASPEDMQEGIKSWMAWSQKCGDGIVDFGAPLGGGMKVAKSGSSPSDSGVMMYSILQAESMEGAMALVQDHPHLSWPGDGEVEVYECMNLPPM